MRHFTNSGLARLHHVSEKSVRNWIKAAREGKLDLQICEQDGKYYVADTTRNIVAIQQLVEKGQKFKNKRAQISLKPTAKFYEICKTKQIVDIISNINTYGELPLQYSYLDSGAEYWDSYASRLSTEEAPNNLTCSINLLKVNIHNLDNLVDKKRKINLVDLGPGNGLPAKELLDLLLKRGQLKRYIAIDISQSMLDITEKHIKQWFGNKIKFEGYVRDFSNERFDDIFAEDYACDDADVPVNLVLLLGGTLDNFRSPGQALQIINRSLNLDDLLIYGGRLDTPNSRRHFDLGIEEKPKPLDFLFTIMIEMLGIKERLYDADQFYDSQKRSRFVAIRPKLEISIEFKLPRGTRTVTLPKNEPLLLWRAWHRNTTEIISLFDQNDFDIMQVTKTADQEFITLMSRIKRGR